MAKFTQAQRAKAAAELKKLLKPGQTVYTVLRHVSSSGMSRVIDVVIPYMRTDTLAVDGDDPRVKIGLDAYTTDADNARRYTRGRIVDLTAKFVTIAYEASADSPPVDETFPRGAVTVYLKTKAYPAVRSIGWLAAQAMDYAWDRDRQGLKVGGCGMDMGFHVVYSLGQTVWPKGTKKPHSTRNGEPDRAGGYALKHQWL